MKVSKLLFALPLMSVSFAALAEIKVDEQKNVSYSELAINADGSVLIGGKEIAKCQGNKVTKLKIATVTCDENYVTVKNKKGESLSRFSGYAKANAGKGDEEGERKQFDDSLAALGSATSGSASVSKTETKVLTSETTAKTAVMAAPGEVGDEAVKPSVNEKTYTPKLGVEAQKSPSIINKQRVAENTKDKKVEKFVEEQKAKSEEPAAPSTVTVKTTESDPKVVETTKTTTISIPADGGAPVTDTELKAKVVKDPSQGE